MGIGLSFAAKACDAQRSLALLESLAEQEGAGFRRGEGSSCVRLCRCGDILFRWQEDSLSGDCQTNVAGPGFHAAAVQFLDRFQQALGSAMKVEDDTEYETHRDFNRMVEEHFYKWLQNMLGVLAQYTEENAYKSLCVCWDMESYSPADLAGTVITPMGRHTISGLLERTRREGIAPFAREFFLWNNPERDALFCRNNALAMLWEDCYFMPSARSEADAGINSGILSLLERAMELDPSLPFPKRVYGELCLLDGREAKDVDSLPDYVPEYPIGYRRDQVMERLGNLLLPVPGYFLYQSQNDGRDNVYYDGGDEDWHSLRLSAFSRGEPLDEFDEGVFEDAVEEPVTFPVGDGRCRAAFAGTVADDGDVYYNTVAEVLSGNQLTLITISYGRQEEKAWAERFLRGIVAKIKDR